MAGQVVPVRVERVGARGEEAVEGVRKGWGFVAALALAGGGRGREREWASEAGSGRRWNTNMRIKAVEGIKAYNRSARISPDRVCLRGYPSIPPVLRVIRTCVRQRIPGRPVDIELPCVVLSDHRHPRDRKMFLIKFDERSL